LLAPKKTGAAVRLARKLIVIMQRPDGGRLKWQIVRPLDHVHALCQLPEEKGITDPSSRRQIAGAPEPKQRQRFYASACEP
jgi:hypothetical protein